MKKVKLYILQFLWLLSVTIEFALSIIVGIVGFIGEKSNELTDVIHVSIEKLKS